jgi:transcriptional regulatory protein RtcR
VSANPAALPSTLVTLVSGRHDARGDDLDTWRPTLALAGHFRPARLDLVTVPKYADIAEAVAADVPGVSPDTRVVLHRLPADPGHDFEASYAAFYDFARARAFDPEAESVLVHISSGNYVQQICLFLLTEARHLPGRLVLTREPGKGDPITVVDLDLARYDKVAARFEASRRDGLALLKDGVPTRNAAYNALMERLELVVTRSAAPILLMGPTGAGKSALARRIYELKRARRQVAGPFVEVNCATLRGDHALSTLFGHARGAFTGATSARAGCLREADGGMLFLDEVGELGLDEQAMLLRAIEQRTFRPLGADRDVHSDFQLVCGTNRDLVAAVEAGRFREDLIVRIGLWTFELPGLRDRLEDLEATLDHELSLYGHQVGERFGFSREARERFLAFAASPDAVWRGNFRDLAASVQRMATLAAGGRITEREVEAEIATLRRAWRGASVAASALATPRADAALGARAAELDLFDRAQLEIVLAAMEKARGLAEAGRLLFGASRRAHRALNDGQRVRKILQRFGLSRGDVVRAE